MIKRILYFILLVALLVGTGAISYILSKQMVNLPDAQAKLQMQAGTASVTIFNDSGTAQPAITVETSQPAPITVGSVITVDGTGSGTLNFAGAQANLAAGGELQVKHYTAQGNEAQIDVVLNRGQISQHIDGYSGSHSYYKIATPAGILTSRNGDFNVQIADNGITYFSATLGTAQITAKEQTITLNSRQGLAIKPGDAPGTPVQWSQVIVPTYRPDGSTVNLPVTLINERTSERFDAYSNRVLLVPPGNYTLKVTAVTTYTLQNLTVTTDQLNELPVTMGEIIFTTTTNGLPINYKGLKIKGDSEVRVVPDQALLVAPSEIKFTVAREEKQDAIQTIDIGVAPGQRITLPLRNELFGGGTVKVDLGSPDGNPVAPVVVNIYTANNENGDPVTTFKSDSTSPVLPSGDYIVSVRTPLAGRYTVTINPNQSVVLPFPLGYLNVNYTDASGKPINRGLVVYIASMTEMQRLNLSVDEMRRTPYGLAINLTTASKVMVPAGIYKVMIADLNDTSQDNLKVDAGQTVPVNLQVSGQ